MRGELMRRGHWRRGALLLMTAAILGVSSCGGSDTASTEPGRTTTSPPSYANDEAQRCNEVLQRGGTIDECQSIIGGTPVPTTVVVAKPPPKGAVAHALDVAGAIKAAAIGCDTASFDPGPLNGGTSGPPATEQVSCAVGDDTIAISLYTDHEALTAMLPIIRQGSCFVASDQPSNLTYVEGENWIVFPQLEENARRIFELIGGSLRTIDC